MNSVHLTPEATGNPIGELYGFLMTEKNVMTKKYCSDKVLICSAIKFQYFHKGRVNTAYSGVT